MKAVLRLELIADGYYQDARAQRQGIVRRPFSFHHQLDIYRFASRELRPWVARLVGLTERGGFNRQFIQGVRDYSHASGTGNRGVFCYYALDSGVHEVNDRTSWNRARRYFLLVTGGALREITREEATAWLSDH